MYIMFLLFDDFYRKTWIYFMKKKDEVFSKFKELKALIENHTEKKIKNFWSDNGREFTSNEFKRLCKESGIKRELSTPYNPQQNGVCCVIGQTRVNSYASHQKKTHRVGPFGNNLRAGCSLTRNSNGVPQNQVSACREGYYCTLAFKHNY